MISENNIPECVGIIMDGNRRWARKNGLPLLQGHQKGYETLKDCLKWANKKGVKYVIVYAFSTENWKRSEEEVGYLMNLLKGALTNEMDSLKEEDVKVRIIGKTDMFSKDLQDGIRDIEEDTKNNSGPTLVAALSYGGRLEIKEAVNKAIERGNPVDDKGFSDLLWTKDIPDPDIIIRTGGEKRLSGFLPWQGVYSELFFVDTLWPDFSQEEFDGILEEFGNRERRFGK